jgi:hypothetical protein
MEESNWLQLVNEGHGGRGRHREYRINPDWIKGADFASIKTVQSEPEKGANDDSKGCTPLHPQLTVKESPVNRQKKRPAKAARLPDEWLLPRSWGQWALELEPSWSEQDVRTMADCFRDYWIAQPDAKARKTDWFATWRNWCRKEQKVSKKAGGAGQWWATDDSANALATKLGVALALPGENRDSFHARIRAALHDAGSRGRPTPAPTAAPPAPAVATPPPSPPPPPAPALAAAPASRKAKPSNLPPLASLVAAPPLQRKTTDFPTTDAKERYVEPPDHHES